MQKCLEKTVPREARPLSLTAENEVMLLARRRSPLAFEEIMRRNNRRLFRVTMSIVKDQAEAEDLVQETYIRAFDKLSQSEPVEHLSPWLVKIAVNESLMRLRKRKKDGHLKLVANEMIDTEDGPLGGRARGRGDDPESSAARAEIRYILEAAIEGLPQPFRSVFVLRALEEFSTQDTADCLGIPSDTVKTRYHRAKRVLRQGLAAQLENALSDAFPFAGSRCDRVVVGVLKQLGFKT